MSLFNAMRNIAIFLCVAMIASACSHDPTKDYKERSVSEIYNEAMGYLQQKQYRYAASSFDEVERQHPYSEWARKGELMAAYSYYMANKYDDAVLAAERFITLHPGSKDAAYAYYLTAICYYEQISDVGRDQKMTEQALTALQDVVRRFPDSVYAKDARLKIDLTQDHLAGKEMNIGRFYEKQGQYLAAAQRFKTVVEKYQTTSHAPEALERLVECDLALGLTTDAEQVAAVLGYNYPTSDWYRYAYNLLEKKRVTSVDRPQSWLSRMWTSVF